MLSLKSATSARWLRQVEADLPSVLVDHAHCEKKAAGTAMNLLFAYGGRSVALAGAMADIVVEELEHFRLVLGILARRGIAFGAQKPSNYGRQLNDLVAKQEPHRAIDRLLVAGLIEARSCERFALLREHVGDRELAEFYGSLFESEARHHGTYVRLAMELGPADIVRARLEELASEES